VFHGDVKHLRSAERKMVRNETRNRSYKRPIELYLHHPCRRKLRVKLFDVIDEVVK
jgi:hypothetical protein